MFSKLTERYKTMPAQAKASLWALICGILQKGISVITTPIFTRLLTTAEYGQYNVFNSWLGILTIIVSLNLSAGVYQQGLVKFENKEKPFSSSFQGLSLTLTTIWTVIYLLFRDFWNGLFGLTTVQMLCMLVIIWSSAAFNFWATEQKNQYKYKALIAATLLISVISPTVCIIFIKLADNRVTARILGGTLVGLIIHFPFFIIQIKHGKKFFSKKYWKYGLLFNLPLIPHYLAQVVLTSSDRIMIERMAGDSFAGIYSLAYSLSMLMLIVTNAMHQTISPWIYKKIKAKQTDGLSNVAYLSLIGIALLNIILILFAPEAVRIFAPPEYYDAIWIIPPVAISVFYIFSYDLFAKFAFYYEKRFFLTVASVFAAALNVILNYICINKFGYIAAGYTTLICYIVYSAGHYLYMCKVCDKYCDGVRPYSLKIIASISAIFTAVGLSLLLTYNYPIIRYSFIVIALVLCAVFHKKIINSVKTFLSLREN